MSIRNSKKNVFSTIGSYSTIGGDWNISQENDTLSSLNENKQPLGFLIDVLKVTVGSEAVKMLVGELLVNITETVESELKNQLIEQLIDYNSDDDLPNDFIINGIEIPIKDIDIYNKLKTDPNSDIGKLLYGQIVEESFNKSAYDSIITESEIEYNNISLEYNEDNDSFLFKPIITTSEITIGDWINDFVNQTTLIEKDIFMSNVLDSIFGTVASNQNKSTEKIFNELKINKTLEKLFEQSQDEDIIDETLNIESDDSDDDDISNILTKDEVNEIYGKAVDIKKGVVRYSVGCDYIFSNIKIENLTNLIDVISTSTNPFQVSNLLEKEAIENSDILTKDDTEEGVLNEDDENREIVKNNREAVSDNFMGNCIDSINLELIKSVTLTPQVIALVSLSNAFKNDCVYEPVNPNEYINKNKKFIKCIIKDVTREINKFIFNLAVTSLTRLIKPIIKIILKEKILAYVNILRSLVKI
jgi:hypothetical protein